VLQQFLPEEALRTVEAERALLTRVREFAEAFEPGGEDQKRVRELLAHLDGMFLLVVVGEVKAGKSSFINALLDADVCPEGPLPLTDRVHVLGYGERDEEFVDEPHIARRTVPVENLKRMNIVDTPGTNSPLKRHQEITEGFLPRADIVFFVTSIDCPLTQTELDLLGQIRERYRKEVACVLAKADLRTDEDRAVVLEYLQDSFRERLGFTPPVFPVSAVLVRRARQEDDDGLLEESGFPAVQKYIVDNLSETQRVRLKLKSPLGAVSDVLTRLDAAASAQGSVLEQDFAGWTAIQEQVEFAATSLKERSERHLAPILVAFENLEARGRRYLRDRIRVRHLRLFSDAGRFREDFTREVLRDAGAEIERKVGDAAQWLGEETKALWERSLAHFHETVPLARYRDQIAAGAGPRFQETREETLARIRESARRDFQAWDVEAERARIRSLASRSLARVLGTEVVAAGVGATVVATLMPTLVGGLGLALAGVIAVGGFLILPARRQKAIEGFEEGVRRTRDALLEAMREAIGEEADRAAAAVLDAFAPFHDFYESRRRALKRTRDGAAALQDEVAKLRATLE